MKQLISFFKRLRLGRVVAVFIAGLALFLTTACNNGNLQGARPEVPPVQMGGQNNPHKAGGDGYSEYKATTDPNVVNQKRSAQDRASLLGDFDRLVADRGVESNASDILYPGEGATSTSAPDFGPRGQENFAKDARQIPAQRQPVVDRSDPDTKILEKAGEAFKDATGFIKDTFEEVEENPAPYQQLNPALGK